ncbi:MAG: hypothetical protein RB191_09020 [Terriglobia bacterium]|nr:hypothetical protein [Terriglobia bacterium]
MIRKQIFVAVLVIFAFFSSRSWSQDVEIENVPDEVLEAVELGQFAQTYSIDGSMNPFYLRGDFDGDGKADYAIRIKSKATQESGIAIWLSSLHKLIVLGAGIQFKVSGFVNTNLDFLNTWEVYGKRPVERGVESGPPPHLIGEAILAGKRESASGLIYWNGKSFVWYQQGD